VGNELLLASAVNGYAPAQYRLADLLLRGDGVEPQRQKGLNWLRYAASQDFVYAQYRMAAELKASDPTGARQWLLKAAEQQHFRSMRDLVIALVQEQAFEQANRWLTKAMSIDDEHPRLWQAKAQILTAKGEVDAAMAATNNAREYAQDRGWSLR
jgi:TPR repeat protein